MTEMERRYYALEAKQLTEPCSERINWLQIILRHLKRMRSSREINDPVVNDEVTIIAARRRFLCFPNIKILSYYSTKQRRKVESYRSKCRKKIGESLSRMGVPEDEHPNICEEVFKVLDVVVCPELPVRVDFVDVTERILLGTADDVHDMVSRESMETYRPNFIPATKSSIEGLEKVRIEDGLEFEAITGQMPSCVICMKSLEPRRRRRQGGGIKKKKKKKKKKRPTMITVTRLPCFHHFHGDCIVKWLIISHLCPMCRYPMPTAEVGQPSNP